MQTVLVVVLGLHGLAGVFWAGATFVLARIGGAGADRLFGPMIGAAGVAILAGGYLMQLTHDGAFGAAEKVLLVGIIAALLALVVQPVGASRGVRLKARDRAPAAQSRLAVTYRVSAALLAITVVAMVTARYF